MSAEASNGWNETLAIAEVAAVPAEQYLESPVLCEQDEKKRMTILTEKDRRSMDLTCFEARLVEERVNSDQVHRVVLLDKAVYNWVCTSDDKAAVSAFADAIEGLKPAAARRAGVHETKIHRRSIVGTKSTFEVLAAAFKDSQYTEKVMLFSPFVAGESNGINNIGILVWAVASDSEASMYKTLISNTEFLRHKVKLQDNFLPHKEGVLELGKDSKW